MRHVLLLALVLCNSLVYATTRTAKLEQNVQRLDKALLEKDSITLKHILHKDLTYGHSNGWVEHKQEVINDLFNGILDYQQIEQTAKPKIDIYDQTGIVRTTIKVTVAVEGKVITLKLHVLQAWIKVRDEWKLFGRQSVQVD